MNRVERDRALRDRARPTGDRSRNAAGAASSPPLSNRIRTETGAIGSGSMNSCGVSAALAGVGASVLSAATDPTWRDAASRIGWT